jgi:hypothetical protein
MRSLLSSGRINQFLQRPILALPSFLAKGKSTKRSWEEFAQKAHSAAGNSNALAPLGLNVTQTSSDRSNM